MLYCGQLAGGLSGRLTTSRGKTLENQTRTFAVLHKGGYLISVAPLWRRIIIGLQLGLTFLLKDCSESKRNKNEVLRFYSSSNRSTYYLFRGILKTTQVLILTGTCGSGKSTLAGLIDRQSGWRRVSEDGIWKQMFHKNRGVFGTDEHRSKRRAVHEVVFNDTIAYVNSGSKVVIDATVHEAPPESHHEYQAFFRENSISWALGVLHPRLEVAIERDRLRTEWHAGEERVRSLRAKFTTKIFPKECFVDTSDQTPEETVLALLDHIDRDREMNGFS